MIIVVLITGRQADQSCPAGRSVGLFGTETGGVITGSLRPNAPKFGQPQSCLKCFVVWLSPGRYVSHSVSSRPAL